MKGKVHMHADMVPIVDDSEIHLDFMVLDGSLNNFAVFDAMSGYFGDKNLDHVRFDTLQNKLDMRDGILTIPSMTINSTLGYVELSGQQSTDMRMEYYIRIPLKLIAKASMQKLFGSNKQDNSGQVDEIEYRDESRRTRFLNIKVEGTPDNYSITLAKEKNNKRRGNEK